VKCYATELGVNLLFIPPWSTDELQPLDRFVFGVMNTNSRRLCDDYVTELSAINKQIATALLVRAWEAVSSEILCDARSIYEDFTQSEH
jgi:hypothetical protein